MPFQSRLKNQINTTTVAVTVNLNCLPRRMRTVEPIARNIDDEALRSSYLRCWARAFYTVNQKGQRAKSKGQREQRSLCSLPFALCRGIMNPARKIQGKEAHSMRVLISGSHGLVGQALIGSLTNDGHEIHRLVRRGRAVGSSEIEWHPNQGLIDADHLEGLDAVVHLAGESIASGRWSAEKKQKIRDSRVNGTQLLSRSLALLSRPPATFICASAIGYY